MLERFLPGFLLLAGAGILALAFIKCGLFVLSCLSGLRAQARRQRLELTLLGERIEAARSARTLREEEERQPKGYRKFVIARRASEAREICSFYLAPHDGKPLPRFKPGQYLTVQIPVPGQARPVRRCYSLSDAPRADCYRISIKHVLPAPGKPGALGGLVSSWFHLLAQEGDLVEAEAPRGTFTLAAAGDAPVVLLAGGIGITPFASMIIAMDETRALRRETWLFLGVRNRAEHPLRERLARAAEAGREWLHYDVTESQPGPEEKLGVDYARQGWLTVDLLKQRLPSNNYHFFVCGPPPLMKALTTGLAAWGVPTEQIHAEAFGEASVESIAALAGPAAGAGATAGEPGKELDITFRRSAKKIAWKPADGTLLKFADAHKIAIDRACKRGGCGSCKVAVLSGEVSYRKAPEYPIEKGTCLACVAFPKGPLTLDA
ncbi:MAG: 2Fe-2S iron-sulfur cluster binding domain-containing protein [Planctomycetes bacterium]|nr:2Fe-2S iron-sulfur cluster binding domain-containing protein [Planctomycetota bacterium]